MTIRSMKKGRPAWARALVLVSGLAVAGLAAGGVGAAGAQGAEPVFAAASTAKLVMPSELRAAFASSTAPRQRVIVTYRAVTPSVSRAAAPALQDAALRTANANASAALVARVLGGASAPRSGGGGAPHNAQAMEFTPNIVIELTPAEIDAFAADADVVGIQLDGFVRPTMDVTTPYIGMPFTWAAGGEGTGRTVAVIDTGVKRAHEFIGSARVVYEACYNTTTANVSASRCPGGVDTLENQAGAAADCLESVADGCGHGTHVAGTMVGFNTSRTVGEPAKGVAPKASLIAINVFSTFTPEQCGTSTPCVAATYGDIVEALNRVYALRNTHSIDAVNMSLGGGQFRTACDDNVTKPAIDLLRTAGIATVIAAGNDAYDLDVGAPGCVSTAVTVAATQRNNDALTSFTNWGNLIDLVAPGAGIVSSVMGASVGDVSSYAAKSGTSMAAPHVAGAFAALKSCAPTKTLSEIETALSSTGVAVSFASVTKPRIDVAAAAKALGCRVPVTVTVSSNRNPAQSGPGNTPTFTAAVTSPVPVTLGTLRIKYAPINNPTIVLTETDPTAPSIGTSKQYARTVDPAIAATTFRVWAEIAATGDHAAATASEFIQVIAPGSATVTPGLVFQVKDISTAAGATSTNALAGEAVTLSVTVSDPSPSPTTPTGTVTIFNGTTAIHTGTLNASGVFSVSNSSFALGAHSLSATYGGTSRFLGRISPSLTLNVTAPPPKVSTTTSLAVTPASPVGFGQQVTLRAVVTGQSGTPTGQVRFFDGITNLGIVDLATQSGQQVAVLNTSALSGGVHSLSAEYLGSIGHFGSDSSNVALTVNPGGTTTTLTVPAVALPGAAPVRVSAIVAPVAPATATPTGTVEFRRDNALVGTAPLVNGVAGLNLTNSPFGYSTITARFLPTTDYSFSDSAPKDLLITYALGDREVIASVGTLFNQNAPSVARLGAGAVVVFNSQSALNGPLGIRHRLVAANGAFIGPSDGLIAAAAPGIGAPHVTGLTNGDFVVTWHQTSGALGRDIFARRFAPGGTARGAAFKVNTVTAGDQLSPQVAALPSGAFVVVWQSPGVDGTGTGIAQRRYRADGRPAGAQTVVNSTTAGNQTSPVIATLPNGTLGVAFVSRLSAAAPIRFLWRVISPTGSPIGTDRTGDGSVFPAPPNIAIAALSTTRFVMAWDRNETALRTSNRDVYVARFTPAGTRDGAVTRVNPLPAGQQFDPAVAAFALGRFIVGYNADDTSLTGLDAHNFTATGARANAPFFLNTVFDNRQHQLSLAPLGGGTNVLGVWTSVGQDGSGDGVYARMIRAP